MRKTPDDVRKTPNDVWKTPKDVRKTPNDVWKTPDDVRKTPDDVRKTPHDVRKAPDAVRKAPDAVRKAPDAVRKTPHDVRKTPNDVRKTPNDVRKTPDDVRSLTLIVCELFPEKSAEFLRAHATSIKNRTWPLHNSLRGPSQLMRPFLNWAVNAVHAVGVSTERIVHMSVTSAAIMIALGLPKGEPVAKLVVRANEIHDSIAANPTTFVTPSPSLAAIKTAVDVLVTTETALKNRLGTRVDRDNAKSALIVLLHGVHAYVQGLASGSPAQADVIAKAASMTLRKAPVTHKSDLAVKPKSQGVVHVAAKALKGAKTHDWQYSTDGGKTWSSAPSTTRSSTLIAGLQPGASVQVKHRVVTKSGVTDWSDPVSAIVT